MLLTDRHNSVAADMERASDCADGMAPDEIIYYSHTNTSQAAFCVMPFRFGLCGSNDRGVLGSERMQTVIRLAHDQVNI